MNDIEKAIEQLDMQIKCTVNTTSIKTCKLAIESLEKQIPKKIDHDYLSCNSCGADLEVFARMDIVHCPWCGQKLDWGVEDGKDC